MKKTPDDNQKAAPALKARGGLRLVPAIVEDTPLPPVPKKKSNLASFFDAYADAIDRDIKSILEL